MLGEFNTVEIEARLSMGTRREARERAVQFLFQYDLEPLEDPEAALERYWECRRADEVHPWRNHVFKPVTSADWLASDSVSWEKQ